MSWDEIPFNKIILDSAFGPRFSSDLYSEDGNIATLRTTDLSSDGTISLNTMPHARIGEDRFKSHFLQAGDLVISRSGRIGTTALFNGYYKPVLPGAFLIRFRLNQSLASPLFYRFFFNSNEGQHRLLSVAQGAAQQNINITNVKKLSIPLPPLSDQRRIARVLVEYDNLIATNQRRIALLEKSARLLYREWFVHLRFSGGPNPAENEIPNGWCKKLFRDVVDTIGGATPDTKRADYWGGEITWLTPTDITRNDCLFLPDSERKITKSGYESCSAKLLPPGTIFMTSRASIGHFALMDQPACTNQGFIAILPRIDNSRNYFLFHLLDRVPEFESISTGSTFKELSKQKFNGLEVLVPDAESLKRFQRITQPHLELVETLKKQNINLAQARDTLLPKLMSGALAV